MPEDHLLADRIWLWDQIYPLKPKVILAQGMEPFRVVGAMCEGKFPHKIILQNSEAFSFSALALLGHMTRNSRHE